jgi:sialate O-acetylesterase
LLAIASKISGGQCPLYINESAKLNRGDFIMRITLVLTFIILLTAAPIHADVKLPALFGDHMVLQNGSQVPVWGWADPGDTVAVSIAGQKVAAVAGPDGKWSVRFSPIRACAEPIEMTVTGRNAITIHDILVGDVWLASGQSNMEFPLKSERNGKEEVPRASHPQIRFFRVPYLLANDPQADCAGKWEVCTPESAAEFSAVAYYFAVDLHKELKVPIGIIGSYRGGSIAQGWTSIEGFRANEALKPFAEEFEAAKLKTAPMMVKYEQAVQKWEKAQKEWEEKAGAARSEGKLPPPPMRAKRPENRILDYRIASLMYNGMIAPIQPYGIKGVIWYQGESDAHNMAEVTRYAAVFPNLIKDWRRIWNDEKLPFLFVQLPNYRQRAAEPGESVWAAMREVQAKALALPNTGMAVTIDLGDFDKPDNIHPKDKLDVGRRLALVAQRVAYGRDVVDSGPVFEKMRIEGNKVHLTFRLGEVPWLNHGVATQPSMITGFTVAGADRKFVRAQAMGESTGLVVWSNAVAAPLAVRYGWADNPELNLWGKGAEGLPMVPFRTDDWPLTDPPPAKTR